MRPTGGWLWARQRRIRAGAPFALVILALLIVLLWLTFKAAALFLVVIGALIGFAIGGAVAYLVARALRRRNTGGFSSVKLFAIWLFYVASTAIVLSSLLLFGTPNWSSSASGGVGMGLLLGFALNFWNTLLPLSTREHLDERTKRRVSSLRFGLRGSGIVAGIVVGIALTSYVFAPLFGYLAG